MKWTSSRWVGQCPRCGRDAYFEVIYSRGFANSSFNLDICDCPGEHPFAVEWGSNKNQVRNIYPTAYTGDIPGWLPDEYLSIQREMLTAFHLGLYRAAVALAGIILDAHVNSLLKAAGDRKKTLKQRVEILAKSGTFDQDQFADATVARLSRNPIVHPNEISEAISKEEANECVEAVLSCLERYYKFRRSKALPAPPGPEDQESDVQ